MNDLPAIQLIDDNEFVVPICSIFRRYLKEHKLKFTTERAEILDMVTAQEGIFEVDDLLAEFLKRSKSKVSRATVYRTMKHLVDSGLVEEVFLDSKQTHYQLCYGRKKKDHFINPETKEIVEFHSRDLENLIYKICKQHGFIPSGHQLIIYGTPDKSK